MAGSNVRNHRVRTPHVRCLACPWGNETDKIACSAILAGVCAADATIVGRRRAPASTARSRPGWGRRPVARKVSRNLIALGTAAIAAVYAAGYARTSSSAGVVPVADRPAQVAGATAPGLSGTLSAGSDAVVGLVDGHYVGVGNGPVGSIRVALSVENGKIADVRIVASTMHYPTARIARLSAQVVERQSAGVDLVSGATYSSRAFRDAIADALARASIPVSPANAGS